MTLLISKSHNKNFRLVDRAMRSDPSQPLEELFGSEIPIGQALDIDDVIKLTSGSLSK